MPMRIPSLIAAALVVSALSGCGGASTPGWSETAESATHDSGTRWPFWPVQMRLHPLSRLVVEEDGQILVEARLEFFEQDDNTTRAYGQVRLEVHDADGIRTSDGQESWNIDLRDLETNRARFDDVIRTYLFRLETDWERMPDEPVLYAYYMAANGALMEATLPLRTE